RLKGFSAGLYPESLNNPEDFIALNGTEILFNVYDSSVGDQLWRSDGTEAGTRLVADFRAGSGFGYRQKLNLGGTVYFIAVDNTLGNGLYKTDGTAAGTVRVKGLEPRPYHSTFSVFAAYRGRVLFATDEPRIGVEPWQTD